jgi:hypothetical protein
MVLELKKCLFSCGLCFEFVEKIVEFEAIEDVNKGLHGGIFQTFYKV